MEFELVTESADDDYAFRAENVDIEFPTFEDEEGERCGICMDVVVDRGVLDCCQHWFCFGCIDNWASITNLCPLCQNEFQLITCVPVYDTIGSSQPDEDTYSRDDDWCVEGKNNTLSFPSYYIDENAVSCLEGDSCKIRSQSANVEDDPNLDTSIACDSCDIWYHAICVGFDPDGSCENSWLCPRCLADETPQQLEIPFLGPSNNHGHESSGNELSVDAAFPRKVSVSVADAGETAVVVSIIDANQQMEVPSEKMLSSLNVSKDLTIGNEEMSQIILPGPDVGKDMEINTSSGDDNGEMDKQMDEKVIKKPKIEAVELDLSLTQGTTSNGKSVESFFHPGSCVGYSMSDGYEATGASKEKNVRKECRLPADKKTDKKEIAIKTAGAKRKQRDYRSAEDGETKTQKQNSIAAKKVKAERSGRIAHYKDQAQGSVSDDSQNITGPMSVSRDRIERKHKSTIDIKEIVQGTYCRPSKRLLCGNLADKCSKDGENASGLRVKKIMRRATEDNESSVVVQNLRKEIRDAIRNRSSKELEDNLFDQKLLAAFRTALSGQTTETRRPASLDLKAKKALLQKGTTRENLTKKIYGIGGKRKRAWTRDCEIEFWKHRCLKVSKPEKVETLKSVLNHLRKSPEITEIKQNDLEAHSSILSRLYVADASVFPRKDDIMPLSAMKATVSPEKSKECTSTEKAQTPPANDSCAKSPQMSEGCVRSTDTSIGGKGTKFNTASKKCEAAANRVNPTKGSKQQSKSTGGSRMDSQNKDGISDHTKIDKRKWALEVLARKNAVSGKNAAQEREDNAVLKGNYPLLAQLQVDMRPVLAPSQHNKIPMSIRQAQLYRLTEHFLRKTNMPVTRRTAEIELAVADAVNVEKAVADRSNSKLVYVNLCSQELLHRDRSDNVDSTRAPGSNPTEDLGDNSETATNDLSTSSEVDEALRNAGLSDSPPNSPGHQMEETMEEGDPSQKIKEDGPDNVFEIDCQPELDIYGDFEYDLEDDDFIGANALKISKSQPDESKIKVVFSTLDSERPDSGWRFEEQEAPTVAENANGDGITEQDLPQNSLVEGAEEEMLGECEELYGPDKEPLFNNCPEIKPPNLVSEKIAAEANGEQLVNNNLVSKNLAGDANGEQGSKLATETTELCSEQSSERLAVPAVVARSSVGEDMSSKPQETEKTKEKKSHADIKKQSDKNNSVFKKVEAYIKEHIRPLCKSGVITVEQYRWAVGKTTHKIMKYHSKDTNANFLIKEGEKVKKLAEQYVEAAQKVENNK